MANKDVDPGTNATSEEPAEKMYTVEGGDSLSAIAEDKLGDASRWQEIYELNKDVIGDDPNAIQPGMELKLPA